MMTVELRYYTEPACEWSWATEPQLRRLIWEFGDSISPRWVM
jgi:predicted DsbA family dithiol-disulfide isomerase